MKDNKIEAKKLIKNKERNITNFVAIITILIIGIAMIGIYPKIDEAGNNDHNLFIYTHSEEFDEDFSKNTFVLYKEALENMQGKAIDASYIYLKPESEFDNSNDYNVLKDKINDYIKYWKKDFENNFLNIDYAVLDKDGNVIKSNNGNDLSSVINSNNTSSLGDKYSFCIAIRFDENGQFYANNIYGAEDCAVNDLVLRKLVYTDNYDIVNPIKNMTFIYAINNKLKYSDKISTSLRSEGSGYENVTYTYILIFSGIIILLTLGIPLRYENEISLYKKFFSLPCEIIIILTSSIIALIISAAPEVIRDSLNGAYVNTALSEILRIDPIIGKPAVYIFNLIFWSIFFTLTAMCTISVKNIFSIGLIKYIKEKTLIGIIILWIKRNIQKAYKNISIVTQNIDLNDKSNRLIIKLISINIIMLIIILALWIGGCVITNSEMFAIFLGPILLVSFYCVILFILIRKILNDIRNKFEILLNATNKIAEGDLEASIAEDVGLFNPIKEQIEKIQKGFKKAVEEEVKSQRMKTELISNVSHDLKTPLTSIITYVNLLKDENITKEDKRSYIDTLDKKSQRLKFLIEDLFEVSKATSGNITLNLDKVDIVELMKQTQFELEDKLNNANLKIKNNFSENKVILELDSQKTFRVFENLLNNVSKYAMKDTRVYVDIIEAKDKVEITIKNMSAEEINFDSHDIIERFQRGDKSRNTEGSGLGLAIAKSFVEAQGGAFNVEVDGDLFKVIILFLK